MRRNSILVLLSVLLVSACGDSTDPGDASPDSEAVLADNVALVEDDGVLTLEAVVDSTYTYSFDGDDHGLAVGDVLYSATESSAYLRKVTSLADQDGMVIVETTDASFAEVILQGGFELQTTLTPALMAEQRHAFEKAVDGVFIDDHGVLHMSDVTLVDESTYSLVMTHAAASFESVLDCYATWDGGIETFGTIYTGTLSLACGLEATAAASVDEGGEILLGELPFPVIWATVPGLPILIPVEPVLSFRAGYTIHCSAQGSISTGVTNQTSLTVGARYDRLTGWVPAWEPSQTLVPDPFDWDASGEALIRAYIEPRFSLRIAWTAGPYVAVDPYLQLELDVDTESAAWALNAGVESRLGMEVTILDHTLADYSMTLTNDMLTILEGSLDFDDTVPIDLIQVYDSVTGLADSPFLDQTVTIEGVITVPPGTYNSFGHAIVDDTGGMEFWLENSSLLLGDRVRITGTVWVYTGAASENIQLADATAELIAHGSPPAPIVLSVMEIAGDHENVGSLVETSGIFRHHPDHRFEFYVDDGDASVLVYIDPTTWIDFSGFSDGDPINVVGVCRNYAGTPEIVPRWSADLR